MRRQWIKLTLISIAASTFTLCASAQNTLKTPAWPTKTLRIVVGFPGGSSPDLTARTLADPLSKALGQPVIVENKVGAGGNIAADYVAKATDNHTLGLMINGNLTTAKLLNPKLPYDPLKDFQPVSLVGVSPLVLMVPKSAPGANAQDFLAAAKQAGDRWSYGSPGVGTIGHIGMELFKSKTATQPVHVPYPGYAQVATAMIGGQLQLSMLPPALAMAQVKGDKLRAIGVTSSGRSALAPELPSMAEVGVPNFNLEIWNAVAAPKSMPPALVAKLAALISDIARSPDVRQKLFAQGWQVVGSSPEGLDKRIQSDTLQFGGIIKTLGVANQ
ncbi:tripartite tricarboxylate transporter substrate binding protein [Rhodoferax sp.]|uniref:Bug family tripartite tricarboxylate transporter substrate binding protein n=1 Tax=Rhodoferax sp. TaxID=50421 RepID=UPI0008BD46C9|nr:tripartite tricarboxylate transporter substrate binding protein [Rhodoferax sp.]MDO8320260.1 tripartite tricarboxylate transporter substrate binding protein [Rhodoferax sp.]MDP2678259.1 tripartite tricarboxylate transporter substrate binding protein [Rhodoferax sp.]OGB53107.1 MAG: receptor [Burkholderiales bacterium RIFOXYD12_FULL_59_19]OGB75837.1 MAG: receptor [Burkholderiales bacterium RIFOXYC12_FULL_60_6]